MIRALGGMHRTSTIAALFLASGCGFGDIEAYRITVTRNGDGTGSVRSMPGDGLGPAAIDCPPRCEVAYGAGSDVVLVATPVPGSTFGGWSGDCTGQAECRLVPDRDLSINATFAKAATPAHEVMVERVGEGLGTVTSTPTGIDCGGDCSETWPIGTRVSLTATPITGAVFSGWSGACSGDAECRFIVNGPVSATATFARRPYTVTVARMGTGTGTVSSAPAGISCGTRCAAAFDFGTMVSLTAAPSPGSVFSGWSGDCSGMGTCLMRVDGAKNIQASFTVITQALTVVRMGAGPGSVRSSDGMISCGMSCTGTYARGTSVTLTAMPDLGATFAGWGGACTGTGTCRVALNVDRMVTATFDPIQPRLTVVRAGGGMGMVTSIPLGITCPPMPTCSAQFVFGAQITLTASAAPGSVFGGWSGLGCSGSALTCAPTLTADGTVTATFR